MNAYDDLFTTDKSGLREIWSSTINSLFLIECL